jgi:hypothetical protein
MIWVVILILVVIIGFLSFSVVYLAERLSNARISLDEARALAIESNKKLATRIYQLEQERGNDV